MSHGITATDGMFTTRQAAWHDLGVVLEEYPTRAQAQALAHPWEPLREDIFRHLPVLRRDENGEIVRDAAGKAVPVKRKGVIVTEPQKLEGWYANVRSDNGAELGVVSEKYVTVSNNELWDIAEAIEQSGSDVMYETGGSLRGGAQVWALVRLAKPLTIKGDKRGETIPYFALQNSHDGSGSFRGQATMTRIVCMNTCQAADYDARARGTEFMFRHTKNVGERIAQAQQALTGWRQAIEDWKIMQEHLITLTVTDEGVQGFLDKFIPMPPKHLITDRVESNINEERAKWLGAYRSVTGEGIENTAYGLVQASTEYANWARKAHNAESRFRRTFLSRDRLTADAVILALDAVKVDA
jgi:phage/plasmid-like protein (TIGR03299 family)